MISRRVKSLLLRFICLNYGLIFHLTIKLPTDFEKNILNTWQHNSSLTTIYIWIETFICNEPDPVKWVKHYILWLTDCPWEVILHQSRCLLVRVTTRQLLIGWRYDDVLFTHENHRHTTVHDMTFRPETTSYNPDLGLTLPEQDGF